MKKLTYKNIKKSFSSSLEDFLIKVIRKIFPRKILYSCKIYILTLETIKRRKYWLPKTIEIKFASIKDINAIANCYLTGEPWYQIRDKLIYKKRFEDGHKCLIANAKNSVVGVVWISKDEYFIEEQNYLLTLNKHSIFIWDGFITPKYRMKGVYIALLEQLIKILEHKQQSKIYCHIDYENIHSLNTHLRFGFQIKEEIVFFSIFSRILLHIIKDKNKKTLKVKFSLK